jgi:perosamine synthetase
VSNLAIHGGPKAVSARPEPMSSLDTAELKAILCRLVDEGVFSDTSDSGIVGRFERSFADHAGCAFGLSFCNGTSALLSAYFAAGVGPGTEVIHPCYSWVASAAPVLLLGARLVFCGVAPDSLLIDPGQIEAFVTPRTRAISVVHMHGNVCRMHEVVDVARAHGLLVIEDCSHCHGALYRSQRCGSVGEIGCFSFQGSPVGGKPIASGEGGMAVCQRRDLYETMLAFAHINRVPAGGFTDGVLRSFAPYNRGMKLRAHPWAMACAALMLRDLDRMNRMKLELRARVLETLRAFEALRPATTAPESTPGGFYGGMNLIYQPERAGGVATEAAIAALKAEGVHCGPAPYPLLHQLPFFREQELVLSASDPGWQRPGTPVDFSRLGPSEHAHARVINILYPMQISAEQAYVTQMLDAFVKVFEHLKRRGSL